MRYDFEMIVELCTDLGFRAEIRCEEECAVLVGDDATLVFFNEKIENDCRIGFDCTAWHYHDDLLFYDPLRGELQVGYLDVLCGLADGTLLVASSWMNGVLCDRWIIHKNCFDDLEQVQPGEEIRISRASRMLV